MNTPLLLVGTLLPSFLVALISIYFLRRYAGRWGLVDHPGDRKVHVQPTPLGGGLGIWLAIVLPFAVGQLILLLAGSSESWRQLLPSWVQGHLPGVRQQVGGLWILLGGGTVLMIVGLLDDLKGLDWKARLGVQFLVATVCVIWQGWRLTAFIDFQAVTWVLSIIWIVALINSFNMLDNMDGASSGVAAIAAAMLATFLLLPVQGESAEPQLFVGGFLLVVTGALLGFLWHNRPPARIFMGDAGSYFVGFCLAVATLLATYTGYQSDRRHAILAPLCVMAVPLYDMVTVLWIRIREGRSPFQADKSHFSHRLVELGFSKTQAVLTIYLTTATCGLGALLLRQVDAIGAAVILLMIVCVLCLIALLESTARRRLNA